MVSPRAIVCGAGAVLVGAAIFACTAGEEINYDAAGLAGDGGVPEGAIVDDSGRIIFESGVPVQERPEAASLPPPKNAPCSGLLTQDGGDCDTSAGLGCCLTAATAACEEQALFAAGTVCSGSGTFFVSCASSTDDSICCWQNDGPGGAQNTRYRSACDGGVEACDPSQPVTTCSNGATCTPSPCKQTGLTIGFCGTPPGGFACP